MSEYPTDLRGLPVWERAGLVLGRADNLETGAQYEFLTEVDPRALISRLEQLRPGSFAYTARQVGEGHWHVTLRRTVAARSDGVPATFVRTPLLALLGDESRRELIAGATQIDLRKGQVACEANHAREWFGAVTDGVLGIFAGAGTRERLLFYVHAGEALGAAELLDCGLSFGRTIALSRTARVLKIPMAAMRKRLACEPAFVRALGVVCAQHVRALAGALSDQVRQPILSRVAIALLPYAAPERGLHPALPPLASMTQSHLAAAAGTVKEVAARAIADLERAAALRRERGHIAYLDRSKLLEIVDHG
ncbi:MAG: DUF2249 domain-containing protein [Candidatus Baltobacteraceae bacterium]